MIGNDTVVLVRREQTGTDELYNPIWTDTETAVTGCSFQAGQPTEDTGLSTTVVSATAKVFMPVTPDTTALASTDKVKYGGRTWQVRGPVIVATDLDGKQDHVWCIAQWTAG